MILTTRGRYAVMSLVFMASCSKEKTMRLSDIAAEQNIPLNYLEQIFAKLKSHQIVISTKGPGGGYRFNNDINQITILDVVNAVEENFRMTRCSGEAHQGCMPNNAQCITHHLWEGLTDHIKIFLEQITLADVVASKGNILVNIDSHKSEEIGMA